MFSSLLFLALVGSSSAFLFGGTKWDGLRVHWGLNVLSSDNFASLPRNEAAAEKAGFKKISDCDDKYSWEGSRWVKNDDHVLVLLYDVRGYIAGIQTTIPDDLPGGYPKTNLQPPFIKNGDEYTLTTYFVDPAIICSTGRSNAELTGTDLYIQNGPSAVNDSMLVPHQEDDIGTTWTKGKCFWTMGQHYWYNLSKDMNCDDFFPIFLMYNKHTLTGFGFAMGIDLDSNRLEHPKISDLSKFFQEVPTCMKKSGNKFSTMHVYLTDSYLTKFC